MTTSSLPKISKESFDLFLNHVLSTEHISNDDDKIYFDSSVFKFLIVSEFCSHPIDNQQFNAFIAKIINPDFTIDLAGLAEALNRFFSCANPNLKINEEIQIKLIEHVINGKMCFDDKISKRKVFKNPKIFERLLDQAVFYFESNEYQGKELYCSHLKTILEHNLETNEIPFDTVEKLMFRMLEYDRIDMINLLFRIINPNDKPFHVDKYVNLFNAITKSLKTVKGKFYRLSFPQAVVNLVREGVKIPKIQKANISIFKLFDKLFELREELPYDVLAQLIKILIDEEEIILLKCIIYPELKLLAKNAGLLKDIHSDFLVKEMQTYFETIQKDFQISLIVPLAFREFRLQNGLSDDCFTKENVIRIRALIEECLYEFSAKHPKILFPKEKREEIVKEIGKLEKLEKSHIEKAIWKAMLY